MEYALWHGSIDSKAASAFVLILVLMEYALWLSKEDYYIVSYNVLILVLMEYALWPWKTWIIATKI